MIRKSGLEDDRPEKSQEFSKIIGVTSAFASFFIRYYAEDEIQFREFLKGL